VTANRSHGAITIQVAETEVASGLMQPPLI